MLKAGLLHASLEKQVLQGAVSAASLLTFAMSTLSAVH